MCPFGVIFLQKAPATVAQSDARPTGDQDVAGSIPRRVLSWRLITKYFYGASADSRKGVVSFWRKKVHEYWLTACPGQENYGTVN